MLEFFVLPLIELLIEGIGFLWQAFSHREERPFEPARPRITVSSVVSGARARPPSPQVVGPGHLGLLGKDAHCLVCRGPLERDVVSCPKCATLHHEDCWEYLQGCSTYGCTLASGRTRSAPPEAPARRRS